MQEQVKNSCNLVLIIRDDSSISWTEALPRGLEVYNSNPLPPVRAITVSATPRKGWSPTNRLFYPHTALPVRIRPWLTAARH